MRSRLSPSEVGIPDRGEDRRVAGLRREEVALLAGVSLTYYTRIERGRLKGVSSNVLHAIIRALRLSDHEAQYLFDLARAQSEGSRSVGSGFEVELPRSVERLISAMSDVPTLALNRLGDPIGGNAMGRALFPHLFPADRQPINHARYVFLDQRSRAFYTDWERSARRVVSFLRLLSGQDPFDRSMNALIRELCSESTDFSSRWAGHGVDTHTSGHKSIRHPIVGELDLEFETMTVGSAPDVRVGTYLTRPGTTSSGRLDRLRECVGSTNTERPTRLVGGSVEQDLKFSARSESL
ncbi:helix-turn-helix domain-containing protein [Rhodococcoides fascians]|uniref:helix-turn-helix domain-containing protein n=1 Tax=Rhodococcoides fascians TaxID=1828 RepID=UPI001E3B0306|nr:helix-turn-helix transcriptional regulator [Rhodococcus fascians]